MSVSSQVKSGLPAPARDHMGSTSVDLAGSGVNRHMVMHVNAAALDQLCILHVRGLPFGVQAGQVREVFALAGSVVTVEMSKGVESQLHSCIVRMASASEARSAITLLHEFQHGRRKATKC